MMKKTMFRRLLCLLLTTAFTAALFATEWKAQTDTVWAGRHYREKDGLATGFSETDSWINWNFDLGTIVVYAVHLPAGHLRSDAVMTTNSGNVVAFRVRLVHPVTGAVLVDQTVKSQPGKTGQQAVEIIPDTELEHDGWYRIELTSTNARSALNRLICLTFQRTSRYAVTAANSMMAPAVHLWWSSTDPKALDSESFDWVYMEALIPEAVKQSCTYQMTIGSSGLYSGIQTNHLLNEDTWTHAVIFSAWDAGDVDKNKTLPDYMRSGALDVGPEAYAVRFGGEGTGASLRYPEGQRWQTDHWVQMLLNERPDYVETVSTDANGKQTLTPFRSTLLSLWYKQAEETEWHYFGTLRMAGNYRMEGNHSGLYSFLENWSGFGGDLYRRVYYRNGSMRSTASGLWYSLNHAGFGSTQSNARNSRNDYGHGVTSLYDRSFYLETGGLQGVRDSADNFTPAVPGEMPWVDTIDIQTLRQRVDLAVLRNHTKDIRMKVEDTRVVSDPDKWVLTSFSDEETVAEGAYGRASQMLDGNTSSYYCNKAYSPYPHTFVFDAGEPVTVSAIGLYQGREKNYRAQQMRLYYSDDGQKWTSAGRLTFEDDDAPTAELSQPVTGRYFRCLFAAGYGNALIINEIYFKHEYRLADLKRLAAQLLAQEDCFSGYRPADLEPLKAVYDEGRVTDVDALREVITQLGATAQPLTWGSLDKMDHLSSFTSYQLHSVAGLGDLVTDADGQLTLTGATASTALSAYRQPTRVSESAANWLILRSERYKEFYLYNLGARKFLNLTETAAVLSDTPMSIQVAFRDKGFQLGPRRAHVRLNPTEEVAVQRSTTVDDAALFELRNNYAVGATDQEIRQLLTECEEYLHGGSGIIGPSTSPQSFAGKIVIVFNLQGQVLFRGRFESIPALPSGAYIIQSGSLVQKAIIQ
ncbi:MAG: DUF3472 domain-containing protein [Bacteroidaceae bacterium]|nr:DUF3472 domain-containing protein [Bacteroidaceae bacterium]